MKHRCRMCMHYINHGIQVCARWLKDFEAFVADVGVKPGPEYTLDRVDNDKGYEPGNVRWVTSGEQAWNKSNNRYLTARGETRHIDAWAKRLGMSKATIYLRLRKGMTEEAALFTPTHRPRYRAV